MSAEHKGQQRIPSDSTLFFTGVGTGIGCGLSIVGGIIANIFGLETGYGAIAGLVTGFSPAIISLVRDFAGKREIME